MLCKCLLFRRRRHLAQEKVLSLTGELRSVENVRREIRAMYQIILHERHELYPILQLVLNPYRFAECETGITSFGSSFIDVIQGPLMVPGEGRSAVVPDPDAFHTFRLFFDALFLYLHGFRKSSLQMPTFYGNFAQINNLDPSRANIIGLRIECSRNIQGFPFLPRMTPQHLQAVETIIKEALDQLEEGQMGNYEPQTNPPLREQDLPPEVACWSYYPIIRRFDSAANFLHHWPIGRGVVANEKKTFVVWVNQEDHLRVVIRQPNGNLHAAYTQLYNGMTRLDDLLEVASDRRIGRYAVDPQRVGNGLRLIAHLHLPQLSRQRKVRGKLIMGLGLSESRPPSKHGEEFVYSYRHSLGCSEYEGFTIFQAGIERILEGEKKLQEVKLEEEGLVDVAIKTLEDYVTGVGDLKALEERMILDPMDKAKEEEKRRASLLELDSRRKKLIQKMIQ